MFLTLIAVFVGSLAFVYALPNARVVASAKQSVKLLETEGIYPAPFVTAGLSLDNFTDALMIDASVADQNRSPLVNALSSEIQSATAPGYTIQALRQSTAGPRTHPVSYSRYWHGYQVVLRPLLVFFSYGDIRLINMLLLGALAFVACVSVRRSLGTPGLAAFVGALLLAGFYVVPLSLAFSPDVYLMLLGVITVLELERRDRFDALAWEFFFFAGALTAFADVLTAPLLTLGMPLAGLLLVRTAREGFGVLQCARLTAVSSFWWAGGYALSWAAKWVIVALVLGGSVITDALSAIAFRAGAGAGSYQGASAVYHNVRYLLPLLRTSENGGLQGGWPSAILILLAILAPLTWLLWRIVTNHLARLRFRRLAPALLVGLLPFVWMAAVSQHSNLLAFFTYRTLAVSVFVLLSVSLYAALDPARYDFGDSDSGLQPPIIETNALSSPDMADEGC